MNIWSITSIAIICLTAIVIILGYASIKFDSDKKDKEIEKLKQDLQRARARKPKKEVHK